MKKKNCAEQKNPPKPKPTKKNKKTQTSDCQTSRCSLKNKSSPLNSIAHTTGTICLFHVLAKHELHEALLRPRD